MVKLLASPSEGLEKKVGVKAWSLPALGQSREMLEDLPSLCVHLVAERLAAGMRGGERVDLGLLSASREVHSLFAAPLYDALDRGCVAELDALRARFHAGVAWVAGVAGGDEGEGGEGGAADGGGPKLRLLLLRAACADAGMSVTGTKGDLSARLDARRREELLRRRELRAAAAELDKSSTSS